MKKFLTGSTALTLMIAATPAFALNPNNAKDHDSTLGAATYAQPQTAAPLQQPAPVAAPQPHAEATPEPATVEPSAGDASTADFTGPYVGGEGMYQKGRAQGWGGGAVAGYGWTPNVDSAWKHAYLGAEAGFDWSGAERDGVAEHRKANVSIRPGYTAGPVLAYAIGDYSRTAFKNNFSGDHDWLSGWGGGGGLQAALPHTPFKTRLEYIYTDYQHSDITDGKAHDNDVKAALIYQIPVKQGSMW